MGFALACLGLLSLLFLAQSAKQGATGPIGFATSLASLPLGIAALWRIAIDVGWWTLLAFVVGSAIVGAVVGFGRRPAVGVIFMLQPVWGIVAVLSIGAAWLLE